MNLKKPIPFFINWHSNSKVAAFMRKHHWWFGGPSSGKAPNSYFAKNSLGLYPILFIYVPIALSILYLDKKWVIMIFILQILHFFVYFFLQYTATASPPYYTTKALSQDEKQRISAELHKKASNG